MIKKSNEKYSLKPSGQFSNTYFATSDAVVAGPN